MISTISQPRTVTKSRYFQKKRGWTGRFLRTDLRGRKPVMEWLFWQVGGLGPMAGQNHHFGVYAPEKIPYAIDRYVQETNRLYGVMDRRLAGRRFLAGDEYSIADMAPYPWVVPWKRQQQNLDDFVNLRRWFDCIHDRPGTRRAYAKGASPSRPSRPSLRRVRSCFSDKRLQALSKPDPTTGLTGALAVLAARQWRDYRARGPGTCFADPGFTPPPACPPNPRQPMRRIGKPEDIAKGSFSPPTSPEASASRSPGNSGRKAAKAG